MSRDELLAGLRECLTGRHRYSWHGATRHWRGLINKTGRVIAKKLRTMEVA
jgi:hypothetical protein